MNRQELIKRIKDLPFSYIWNEPYLNKEVVLDMIKQLDESQKVKVPQFVAEWYEENKDVFEANLYRYAYNIPSVFDSDKLNEFERWFLTAGKKPFQTLVNMHQFGYEVEKEPKYTVKFKATNQYLCDDDGIGLHISPSFRSNFRKSDLEKLSLTEVFDSSLFEVEEVEE